MRIPAILPGVKQRRGLIIFLLAAGLYTASSAIAWHEDIAVRRATGVVLATLVLWISEIAPLGVTAMAIPIVAAFTGLLPWNRAVAAWGSDIVFLFLGAFLLARALDKHGVFDWILSLRWGIVRPGGEGVLLVLAVLLMSGTLSLMQNNTAVTAMTLPLVLALTRRVRTAAPALLALAWGSTFGGMATPVGTAPNFIGFSAMKDIDESVNFISWMKVGVPVWLGTTLIGWGVLAVASRLFLRNDDPIRAERSRLARWLDGWLVTDLGPTTVAHPVAVSDDRIADSRPELIDESANEAQRRTETTPFARQVVVCCFALAVLLWLVPAIARSVLPPDHSASIWFRTYLPESLVPVMIAWLLFMIPTGEGRKTILDRHDFQALDWDTLFLIAGGLSLGQMLETSGFATALSTGLAHAELPPLVLMLGLVGSTVLLSELTSNTATAALMVPVAGSLATALGLSPVQAIWLVALAASLGFALPISTPPNAIVYGTRQIPLRFMIITGITVDVLATIWLVCCVTLWA